MTPIQELQKPIIKTELPGPNAREIIAADAQYVTPSYPRPDYKLVAEKGYGAWIEDVDGNVFLDCNAGALQISGWQCPVEQTATPALQSKKTFPSTSSIHAP